MIGQSTNGTRQQMGDAVLENLATFDFQIEALDKFEAHAQFTEVCFNLLFNFQPL